MQKFKYLTKQNDDSLLNKYDYEELKKKNNNTIIKIQ